MKTRFEVVEYKLDEYHPFRTTNGEEVWYKIKDNDTGRLSLGAYLTKDLAEKRMGAMSEN